jgi:OHCU decarboxylase
VNAILDAWNTASEADAVGAMLTCCGARRWAAAVVAQRPYVRLMEMRVAADMAWAKMEESDLLEAFACHPRIGERSVAQGQSGDWSQEEQSSVNSADQDVLAQLVTGNKKYEDCFGFTYIVCATDKSAEEMLSMLNRRLSNNRADELSEAAEQQRLIMQIRISKWLGI